ncbi:MAG: hypothetical protein Q8S22_10130 [Eubacteriales bacterium]|jgi:hypothetical protein|nr:hypothetical protein [Eubacteriales bacterium]
MTKAVKGETIPYLTLYYTAAYADEWVPNGETEWNDYTIQQISQEELDAILAEARGEEPPAASATPAPTTLQAETRKQKGANNNAPLRDLRLFFFTRFAGSFQFVQFKERFSFGSHGFVVSLCGFSRLAVVFLPLARNKHDGADDGAHCKHRKNELGKIARHKGHDRVETIDGEEHERHETEDNRQMRQRTG